MRFHFFRAGLVLGLIQSAWAQPIITHQPQNQTNLAGTTATFTVGATGVEPLSYQWRSYLAAGTTFTNIPFGTEAVLRLDDVQPTTRRFAVVVTDSGGLSATSSPLASLTVLTPPRITVQPAVQLTTLGAAAVFTVTATGTAPLTYQWRFNEADLTDKTNRTLSLSSLQPSQAGNYSVVVVNAFGSVTSQAAALMFTTPHRFEGITANSDHSISLGLAGVVPKTFAPYYDLYPLEVSTNLVDWTPLTTLLRTNNSTAALSYVDTEAKSLDQRFYRTPTNFFTTPFPKPSGPYAVGTLARLLTDPSRTNRYDIRTNSSFMVQCWYPAEARAGVLPEAWLEQKLVEADPSEWSPYPKPVGTLAQLKSHARPGLPIATNQTSYPVVLYSSTWSGRRGNTDKAVELASHGYVVVGVDHRGILASVFPSGQVVYGAAVGLDIALTQSQLVDGIKDLRFVLEELGRLNVDDLLLAGRLDLGRLGVFGFSYGSMLAAEFCRSDARCKAAVLFDPGSILEAAKTLDQVGLQKPYLLMNSTAGWIDVGNVYGPWLASATNLFAHAISDAYWFQIQDSTHHSFKDAGSLINDQTETGDPTPASRAQSQTIRACTLSFFNKYLKGEDDHLLDNPAAVHPNIINFRRK